MAGRPYVSSRSGRFQWIMQRVSAVLLIGLAFTHFALQHFTSSAVSTGLTVSQRFNDPWWQGFYIIFVVLGLYHGINGLVGILYDYMPRPLWRGICSTTLWTTGLFFMVVGSAAVLDPRPLGDVKQHYAIHGFSAGSSRGSPPVAPARSYDYRREDMELNLLRHYLALHTHHDSAVEVDAIFGDGPVDTARAVAAGERLDDWIARRIADGPVRDSERDHSQIFASSYEFAVWAANVRQANAQERLARTDSDQASAAVLERLAGSPRYQAELF